MRYAKLPIENDSQQSEQDAGTVKVNKDNGPK